MQNWIRAFWMPWKKGRRDALVAVLDPQTPRSNAANRFRNYLHQMAEQTGMDFFGVCVLRFTNANRGRRRGLNSHRGHPVGGGGLGSENIFGRPDVNVMQHRKSRIEDYEPLAGAETVAVLILTKAAALWDFMPSTSIPLTMAACQLLKSSVTLLLNDGHPGQAGAYCKGRLIFRHHQATYNALWAGCPSSSQRPPHLRIRRI